MKELNSTTNIATLLVIILTALFVGVDMVLDVKVDPMVYGFWGSILGFVVGQKAAKGGAAGVTKAVEVKNGNESLSVKYSSKEDKDDDDVDAEQLAKALGLK